jgi:hypothetical protein
MSGAKSDSIKKRRRLMPNSGYIKHSPIVNYRFVKLFFVGTNLFELPIDQF